MSLQDRILESLSQKLGWQWQQTDCNLAHSSLVREWILHPRKYAISVSFFSPQKLEIMCSYVFDKELDDDEYCGAEDFARYFVAYTPTLGSIGLGFNSFASSCQQVVSMHADLSVPTWVRLIESHVNALADDLSSFVAAFEKAKMGMDFETCMSLTIEPTVLISGHA